MGLLTRIHLWVGEVLGLTHYRNCWSCGHCREFEGDERAIVLCDLCLNEDGVCAITDPCEAVWCDGFAKRAKTGRPE